MKYLVLALILGKRLQEKGRCNHRPFFTALPGYFFSQRRLPVNQPLPLFEELTTCKLP